MAVFADRIKETTTTTGTGTLTLGGAVQGYRTFNGNITNGSTVVYVIVNPDETQWEIGSGVFTSPSTLTRTVVYSSTNSNALVSFAAGTKYVYITIDTNSFNGKQDLLVSGTNIKTINGTAVLGSGNIATVAGSNKQIQFNNSGALAASADLTFDDATNTLALPGTDTGIELAGVTNIPAAPAAGTGRLFTESVAGNVLPKWIGPNGKDYIVQSHFGQNDISMWKGGATTAAATFASTIGSLPYTSSSPAAPLIPALTTANLKSQTYRSTIGTGVIAGTLAYIRGNSLRIWRGNAAGLGGFIIVHRFGMAGLQTGNRAFAGIQDTAANPTNIDPTTATTPGRIGMAINASTGNWNLVNNITGTAPTILALGANYPVDTTTLYELILFCPPNGSSIGYRITNLSTNIQTNGTLTTNIPSNTTFLTPTVWCSNNGQIASVTMDFVVTYVETYY